MRGHVIGRPGRARFSPFTLRAWEGPQGWIGQVYSGGHLHVSLVLTPVPTRGDALDLADAWARRRAKTEGYPFPGADRPTGEVRVVAEGRPYSSGEPARASVGASDGESRDARLARFAPGYRLVSIDGVAA